MGRMMSQNRGFLFPEKRFSHFWGVQHAILTPTDVPKSEFLISGKKVFAFLGGATCDFDADGCPKIGVSCFRKKGFRILRTCHKIWHAHFWAFLILEFWQPNLITTYFHACIVINSYQMMWFQFL